MAAQFLFLQLDHLRTAAPPPWGSFVLLENVVEMDLKHWFHIGREATGKTVQVSVDLIANESQLKQLPSPQQRTTTQFR